MFSMPVHFWPIVLAAIGDTITVFGTAALPVLLNMAILLFPPAAWIFTFVCAPRPFGWRTHMKSSLLSQFAPGPYAKQHWKQILYFSVIAMMLGNNLLTEAYKSGVESTRSDIERIASHGAEAQK